MRSLDWYKRDESDVIEAFSHACKRKSYFNWDTDIMSNAEATQGACQTVLSGWGDTHEHDRKQPERRERAGEPHEPEFARWRAHEPALGG